MGPADGVIHARLALLNEYVNDLRELGAADFQTYLENKLIRRAVERTLQLAVEACLDVAQHIIAQEGYRRPVDSADTFAVLTEAGILPDDLLPRLVAMAKFRNLIVHDYTRLDDQVVFGILKRQLSDFDAYARAIAAYLDAPDR